MKILDIVVHLLAQFLYYFLTFLFWQKVHNAFAGYYPVNADVILSKTTILNDANLKEKQKVSFELAFLAQGLLERL